MPRGRGGHNGSLGVIRPQDHDTDDTHAPIAAGEALNSDHAVAIEETESKAISTGCRRDYRNRNKRYIEWLKVEYPQTCEGGTHKLTPENIAKPNTYYFNKTPRPHVS